MQFPPSVTLARMILHWVLEHQGHKFSQVQFSLSVALARMILHWVLEHQGHKFSQVQFSLSVALARMILHWVLVVFTRNTKAISVHKCNFHFLWPWLE